MTVIDVVIDEIDVVINEKGENIHREIISRHDPLSGCGFHLIHPDLPRGAPDPPSSAPIGSGSALIQTRASFQIGIHV